MAFLLTLRLSPSFRRPFLLSSPCPFQLPSPSHSHSFTHSLAQGKCEHLLSGILPNPPVLPASSCPPSYSPCPPDTVESRQSPPPCPMEGPFPGASSQGLHCGSCRPLHLFTRISGSPPHLRPAPAARRLSPGRELVPVCCGRGHSPPTPPPGMPLTALLTPSRPADPASRLAWPGAPPHAGFSFSPVPASPLCPALSWGTGEREQLSPPTYSPCAL